MQADKSQAMIAAALGLAGEAGEFADTLKKILYHDKPIDVETVSHLMHELGDIMWYVALGAHSLGVDLETIARMNDAKLEKRYPNGFDAARANAPREPESIVDAPRPDPFPESEWVYDNGLDRFVFDTPVGYALVTPYPSSVMLRVYRTDGTNIVDARIATLDVAKQEAITILRKVYEAEETGKRR